jgi:large subunit ribosomal protein L18
MSRQSKAIRLKRRKIHIRKKVSGTPERPRVTIFRSLKHIYIQAIDDTNGLTIAFAGTLNDSLVNDLKSNSDSSVNIAVGKALAQRLNEKSITNAVFDRNGYLYHGRVKSVVDGIREGGIQV